MANNRCVAEQRAVGLKRKLMKNKEFLEDYRRFMDSILEKGYAMEVRQDQLSRDDNRVWYVPHHEDVSLNGQLMQGPDLTNTLIGALMRFREEPIAMMADIESMFYQCTYDPLGFLVPLILPAKFLMRDLCKEKLGWDEEFSDSQTERWYKWLEDLTLVSGFSISRCVKPKNFGTTKVARLHHFSDASEVAYGTASYLVLENDKGRIHCSLVMGKSRVSPLKQITVPRLELTAAVVAVKVDRMLQEEMQIPLQQSIFWTDSTTVLKYIDSETACYKRDVLSYRSPTRSAAHLPPSFFY
ncbi:hypothetical protein D4764_0241980 [Takifugu flavidus]|uniref:Reverse transcriptase domain-containing protein n=1 Tax=Takifugu flavidus TaxID=433684 RepID=A0A5C6MG29_9TELE|nr:hypothetical protein D4764_0241980 [Takifugu flavidus]